MTQLRRLDHVALAVRDTDAAVADLRERLGLKVIHSEELATPPVRLTYLDAGNCYLQLVEPLSADAEVARFIDERGEGLHHLCFGVDDVAAGLSALAPGADIPLGRGRGRPSAFLPFLVATVRVEVTEFHHDEDTSRILQVS